MGWERGRYYTRSRKVDGRVIREYVGGGAAGALAAHQDAVKRERREQERERWRSEKEEIEAFDDAIDEVCQEVDLIARAAIIAAGYHHHRGEWRRRRVQTERNQES